MTNHELKQILGKGELYVESSKAEISADFFDDMFK